MTGKAAHAKQTRRPRQLNSAARYAQYKAGSPARELKLTIKMVLAARLWRALVDEKLRPLKHSSSRMEALGAISASPPLSPQMDIARRLRIEGPTLTRMIQGLEKEQLIVRQADPKDGRSKLLALTADGESALEEIFHISDELRVDLLNGIDDSTLATVEAFFDHVIRRLDGGLREGTTDDGMTERGD